MARRGTSTDLELEKRATTIMTVLAKLASFVIDRRAEERGRDDLQRERHHLLVYVEQLPVVPGVTHALRQRHHRGGILGDPITMEGRLREPTLAQVEISFAREESVAEERTGTIERAKRPESQAAAAR